MNGQNKILWVDEGITLPKTTHYFLGKKFLVFSYNNGRDAVDLFEEANFDESWFSLMRIYLNDGLGYKK
jgi:hypothetical protein